MLILLLVSDWDTIDTVDTIDFCWDTVEYSMTLILTVAEERFTGDDPLKAVDVTLLSLLVINIVVETFAKMSTFTDEEILFSKGISLAIIEGGIEIHGSTTVVVQKHRLVTVCALEVERFIADVEGVINVLFKTVVESIAKVCFDDSTSLLENSWEFIIVLSLKVLFIIGL